jgi:hypothetical protein
MASSGISDRSLTAQAEQLISRQAYEVLAASLKRKRRRRNWTEFVRTVKPQATDRDGGVGVKEWILSLSQAQRQECLSYEHSWLCQVINRMFKRKVRDGEGSFSLQEERLASGEIYPSDDCFHFQKKEHGVHRPGAKHILETELEGLVRLTDSEEYLDTLTVSLAAVKDPQRVLQLLSDLTQGQALVEPCRVTWDTSFKMYVVDSPAWFSATAYNSIATWICCGLEKAIWTMYWWEHPASDHRRVGEVGENIKLSYMEDSASFIEFWSAVSRPRRADMLGNDLAQELLEFSLEEKKSEPDVYVSSQLYGPGLLSSCLLLPKYAELKRKISLYNSKDSVRDLTQVALDRSADETFEFLLLSPLDRAGTRLDQLCRKVAKRLKAEVSRNAADDLLISELSEKPSKGTSKRRKKRPSKAREETAHGEEGHGREDVASSLTNVLDDIKKESPKEAPRPLVVEEDNFLTMQPRRRTKPTPKVQGKRDRKTKARPKKPLQQPRVSPSPLVQSSLNAYVLWEAPESSAQVISSEEFPPLAPVQVVPSYEKLTREIERMQRHIEAEVEGLKPSRLSLIRKIDDIVESLFPGSFMRLYGSYTTGLALPWSDIDLVVVNSSIYNSALLITCLKDLGDAFSNCAWASRVMVLDKATLPVVKLTAEGSYFGCDGLIEADISFDDRCLEKPGNSGMATTQMTQDILCKQPEVLPLCVVLKQLLHKHKLNSAFQGKAYIGGVNSYTITLWVAAYLVSLKDPQSSGAHLLGFLDFFGNKFQSASTSISLKEGGFVSRESSSYGAVETRDPNDLSNNTSRSSFKFEIIQELFRTTHSRLMHWSNFPSKSAKSLLSSL